MPSSPTKYSFAQLEGLWIQAGGDRPSAPIMAAIALAESGGNPAATNTSNSDGSTDRGLWQINSVHGSLSTYDPMANAKSAVKIKSTQGLKAWTTYTSGAYRKFLSGNVPPDTSNLPSGSTPTTNGTDANWQGDIGKAIGKGFGDAFTAVLQPIMAFMLWGSEIMFGLALMVGGIVVYVVNTEAGKNAAKRTVTTGLDVASLAAPEAAPELQSAKALGTRPTRTIQGRAQKTAASTTRTRQAQAKAKEQRVKRSSSNRQS